MKENDTTKATTSSLSRPAAISAQFDEVVALIEAARQRAAAAVIILGQARSSEEREFYLRMSIREGWASRELERQFRCGLFERAVLSPPIVSAVLRQLQPDASSMFKDAYFLEFLDLPRDHSDADLPSSPSTSGSSSSTWRRWIAT